MKILVMSFNWKKQRISYLNSNPSRWFQKIFSTQKHNEFFRAYSIGSYNIQINSLEYEILQYYQHESLVKTFKAWPICRSIFQLTFHFPRYNFSCNIIIPFLPIQYFCRCILLIAKCVVKLLPWETYITSPI